MEAVEYYMKSYKLKPDLADEDVAKSVIARGKPKVAFGCKKVLTAFV